ncbi:MAG: MFS transporter [Anaerolineaceae bacterium]|nr:MFS transporter [Anaerolineaceae bacterium]
MVALTRRNWRIARFVLVLLAIELLDELVFGIREAAWPLIRDDLSLTYAQVGILLSLPSFLANFIEPVLGILGDVWRRRILVLGGGAVFTLALLMVAFSESFGLLLAAFVLFNPASGAFVSLSQAALMDHDPERHEQNMARWTFAGSIGVSGGPLLLGLGIALGLGWRGLYLLLALATLALMAAASRYSFPNGTDDKAEDETTTGFREGVRDALGALRRREVLRWLTLLEFSDFMLDILLGYLALYMVDIAGASEAQAGIAVAVWAVVGLVGDLLIIPLLERVRGLTYLRVSVVIELILYPAFLLVEPYVAKLVILGLLGFFNAGWYSILQAQLYSAMPGQSGTVMAVHSVFGLVASLFPLMIGLAAEQVGLNGAMWLLLAGPAALMIGLPRRKPGE